MSERLLDATIQCLAEHGYSATTTRRVAQLAGVSQGAQQHYFPTKAALVEAAMRRLMDQLMADAVARKVSALPESQRVEAFVDLVVDMHRQPATAAVLELFTAARTDPALGACTATMTATGTEMLLAFAHEALPSHAARPGFDDVVQLAMALARGTEMLAAVPGADASRPAWDVVRRHLVEAFNTLV